MEFYFQSNSVMNSLKCSKSKSLSHCLTELLPIYQNKHGTIRRRDDCSVDPSSHRIILNIVGFLVITNLGGQLLLNILPTQIICPNTFIWQLFLCFLVWFENWNMLSNLFTFTFGDSGNQGVPSNSMDHDCDKNLLGITLTFVH